MEGEFEAEIKGEYGLQLAKGVVQGQSKSLEQKYGQNPDGRSHVESFLLFLSKGSIPRDSTCSMNRKPRFHRSIR
ncbi:MAG: hypothetical protein ACJ0DH_04075 [bacterium]